MFEPDVFEPEAIHVAAPIAESAVVESVGPATPVPEAETYASEPAPEPEPIVVEAAVAAPEPVPEPASPVLTVVPRPEPDPAPRPEPVDASASFVRPRLGGRTRAASGRGDRFRGPDRGAFLRLFSGLRES